MSFIVIFFLANIITILQNTEHVFGIKTYMIVGDRAAGKSTLGNCILSKSSSLNDIKNVPFDTRETTSEIKVSENRWTRVIDIFGFSDQKKDPSYVLKQLRKALDGGNYKVNAVVYMIANEPLRKETAELLKLMQQDIFKNVTRNNSILICSGCDEGWLDEERTVNADLNSIIENCGNLTYNFVINLDDNDITEKAVRARKKSIDDLKRFLDEHTFEKLDLSFMKEDSYKVFFLRKISDYKSHLIGTSIGVGVVGSLLAIAKVAGVLR